MANRREIRAQLASGITSALAPVALALLFLPAAAFAKAPVTRYVSHDPACSGHTP